MFNADYWRMNTQKAFLFKPGVPGSLSLFGINGQMHQKIADHITAEILVELIRGDIADYYNWHIKPGYQNDLLDALVMSEVAGAICGATMTGGEKSWSPRRPTSKTRGKVSYPEI